jgi:hypothetical protein
MDASACVIHRSVIVLVGGSDKFYGRCADVWVIETGRKIVSMEIYIKGLRMLLSTELLGILNKPSLSDFYFEFSNGYQLFVHKCILYVRAPHLYSVLSIANNSKVHVEYNLHVEIFINKVVIVSRHFNFLCITCMVT